MVSQCILRHWWLYDVYIDPIQCRIEIQCRALRSGYFMSANFTHLWIKCTLGPTCASIARWIRVRVRVIVRVLFRQTLDEWMGPKVHFFPIYLWIWFYFKYIPIPVHIRALKIYTYRLNQKYMWKCITFTVTIATTQIYSTLVCDLSNIFLREILSKRANGSRIKPPYLKVCSNLALFTVNFTMQLKKKSFTSGFWKNRRRVFFNFYSLLKKRL